MEEAKLKRLHTAWLELYDISAKINLERQILVTVRGKARQGGEMNRWTTKAFYGSGNAIWYHKDGHISLCAVLSHSVISDCLRPMDCNLPGSSVHGILQAKILGWFAMHSPRGSSQPRDWTQVSLTVRRILYHLRHQGSPRILQWIAYPFSRGRSPGSNQDFTHCRQILYQLSYQGSHMSLYIHPNAQNIQHQRCTVM